MIVEFIGMPASGKTTLAKGVFDKCGAKSAVYPLFELYNKKWIVRNIIKVFCAFQYVFMHPIKAKNFAFFIIRHGQKENFDYFRIIFNNLFLFCINKKYQESRKICILDEGVLHHIWAIQFGTKKNFDLKTLLNFYNLSDIIIYIKADEVLLQSRNQERPHKNQRHLKILENLKAEIIRMDQIYNSTKLLDAFSDTSVFFEIENCDITNTKKNIDTIYNLIVKENI